MNDKRNEARRILNNMWRVPEYNGTTTSDVIDELCEISSTLVLCNGHARNIVFTPITKNTIAFKTVQA